MPLPSRVERWARPRPIEACATAIFSLYVAWPFLSLSQYVTGYDTVTYTGPVLTFTFRELRSGRLPLWNDQLFAGVPHLANPQASVLYPPKLPFIFFEPSRALNLITGLHVLILAAGMFVLLTRALRLRAPAGFVGTVAFVGSGLVMVRARQYEQLAVLAWVPWVLAGIERAVRTPRLPGRGIVLLAAVTAMLLLAGHPQQVYMNLVLILVWTLVRAHDHGDDWRDRAARVARVAAGGVLGLLLAAPQLLTTAAQLSTLASTSGRTLQIPSDPGYTLVPDRIPAALLGAAFDEQSVDTAASFEAASFVGAGVLVLAAIGLFVLFGARRSRVTAAGLLASVCFAILVSTGPQCHYGDPNAITCDKSGFGYRFLFFNLPGFDFARVPARWMGVAVLALALLAAFATHAIAARRVPRAAVAAGVALLAAVAGAATIRNVDWGAAGAVTASSATLWLVAAVAVLGAALVAGDAVASTTARERARPGRLAVAAALVPAACVAVELGIPVSHSEARYALTDRGYDQSSSAIDVFLRNEGDRVLSMADQPFDDFAYLAQALRPNTNSIEGIRTIDGYDGGPWLRLPWVHAVDSFTAGGMNIDLPLNLQTQTPPNKTLMTRYGVKYYLIDIGSWVELYGIPNPGSDKAKAEARKIAADGYVGPVFADGDLEVFENPDYRAEARVVYRTREVDGAWNQWFRTLSTVPTDEALVLAGTPGRRAACDEPVDACAAMPVELSRPRPGSIDATLTSGRSGILVVPEQNAPGWSATVDGEAVEIQTVDAMSIGVPVDAGNHRVELRYRAPGLTAGIVLALLAIAALAVCWRDPWARSARRDRVPEQVEGAPPTD